LAPIYSGYAVAGRDIGELITEIANEAKAFFVRIGRTGSKQQIAMASVEYDGIFAQLIEILSPEYFRDAIDNPQYWHHPEQRITEVVAALDAVKQQLVLNIRQLNAAKDIDLQVALKTLEIIAEDDEFAALYELDTEAESAVEPDSSISVAEVPDIWQDLQDLHELFDTAESPSPIPQEMPATATGDAELQDQFSAYLAERGYRTVTAAGNPSTVYDYVRRVDRVSKEEGLTWAELARRMDIVFPLYDIGGAKEAIGRKSNRSVLNALKRYQEFMVEKGLQE
jgi:hypothetical protein